MTTQLFFPQTAWKPLSKLLFLSCQDIRLLAILPAREEILSPGPTAWQFGTGPFVTCSSYSSVFWRWLSTFPLSPPPSLHIFLFFLFLLVFPWWPLCWNQRQTADRNIPWISLHLDQVIGTLHWPLSNPQLAILVCLLFKAQEFDSAPRAKCCHC